MEKNEEDLVDDLGITEIDDSEYSALQQSDMLVYPSLVIEGVITVEELSFFARRKFNARVSLPMYVKHCGITKKIGSLDMTMDAFQGIAAIARYRVVLWKTPTDSVVLDLEKPDTFIKLIKL